MPIDFKIKFKSKLALIGKLNNSKNVLNKFDAVSRNRENCSYFGFQGLKFRTVQKKFKQFDEARIKLRIK